MKKWAYFVTTNTQLLDPKTNQPAFTKYGAIQKQIFYHKYGLKTNIGGGIGWDQVQSIVWALGKAGGEDPAKMRAAFESTAKASAGSVHAGGIVYTSRTRTLRLSAGQVSMAHLYGVPSGRATTSGIVGFGGELLLLRN